MTDEERSALYGRAMLKLRQCKLDIAALELYFVEYAERLTEASGAVRHFLSDPCAIAVDDLAIAEHVKKWNLRLTKAGFGDKVDELSNLTRRARELQERVDKF